MRVDYAEAVERQSEWLRFSNSPTGTRMWDEMRRHSRNPYERVIYEAPLREGEVFFVGTDFCRLIEAAQESLPDATFRPEMVPTLSGWAWLEKPLQLPMTAEQQKFAEREAEEYASVRAGTSEIVTNLRVDALGWIADGGAYHFTAYTMTRAGESTLITHTRTGASVTTRMWEYLFMPTANWSMRPGQSLAARIAEFEQAASAESRYVRTDIHEMRYVIAMCLLMEQRILTTRREPLDRARRRRIARAGLERDHLQVVTLRRYQERGADAEHAAEVDWSCRWIVRGHWRQQYYASTGEHRPKWIMPFVKGPEDKPMKDDQRRVYAAVR